jgi:hypothetical protein
MEVPEAASSGHHLLRFAQTALDPGSHVNLEGSRNDPLGAQAGLSYVFCRFAPDRFGKPSLPWLWRKLPWYRVWIRRLARLLLLHFFQFLQ